MLASLEVLNRLLWEAIFLASPRLRAERSDHSIKSNAYTSTLA